MKIRFLLVLIFLLLTLSYAISINHIDANPNPRLKEIRLSQILDEDFEYNGFKFVARIENDKLIVRVFQKDEYSSLSYIFPLSTLNKQYLTLADSRGSMIHFYIKNDLSEARRSSVSGKRYIVEFKEAPILAKRAEIENGIKSEPLLHKEKFQNHDKLKTEEKIELHTRLINETHELAKKEIKRISSKKGFKQPVIKEFKNLFNGMVVIVDEDSIEEIKNLRYVKDVYEDARVKVFLENSIPLINAAELWKLKDDSDRNITGEGIKIAIIDTGIDYTHPDLGNCTKPQFINGSCEKVVGGYNPAKLGYGKQPQSSFGPSSG
jgi:hypothetical protein